MSHSKSTIELSADHKSTKYAAAISKASERVNAFLTEEAKYEILKKIVPYGPFLGLDKDFHIDSIAGMLNPESNTYILNLGLQESQFHKLKCGNDGKIYKGIYGGGIELFSTNEELSYSNTRKPRIEKYLCVLSAKGEIFTHNNPEKDLSNRARGKISHASFTTSEDGSKQCLFAGMMKVKNGKITYIDPLSGHFKPHMRHLYNAVEKLSNAGLFDTDAKIGVVDYTVHDAFADSRDQPLKFYSVTEFLEAHREEALSDWQRVHGKRAAQYGLDAAQTAEYITAQMQQNRDITLPISDVTQFRIEASNQDSVSNSSSSIFSDISSESFDWGSPIQTNKRGRIDKSSNSLDWGSPIKMAPDISSSDCLISHSFTEINDGEPSLSTGNKRNFTEVSTPKSPDNAGIGSFSSRFAASTPPSSRAENITRKREYQSPGIPSFG